MRKKASSHLNIFCDFVSPLLFFMLAFCSAYWWSGFPYDNLCPAGTVGQYSRYIGDHIIDTKNRTGENITQNVTVDSGDIMYQFCSQDMLNPFRFPPLPREQCQMQGYDASPQCTREDDIRWMTTGNENYDFVTIMLFSWNQLQNCHRSRKSNKSLWLVSCSYMCLKWDLSCSLSVQLFSRIFSSRRCK